jgi:hypothetical protein
VERAQQEHSAERLVHVSGLWHAARRVAQRVLAALACSTARRLLLRAQYVLPSLQ